jgi:hypothetical protein
MTATQIRPATWLSPLVAGTRTAVECHADWAETAQLVAEQLRRHLPTPDVLTAAQRLGSPDDYCGQPVRRAGRIVLDRRPGLAARADHPDPRPHDLVRLRRHPGRRATRSCSTPT